MSAEPRKYSPIQQRLLTVLSDGLEHHRNDLMPCIGDELTTVKNMRNHIRLLRRKLQPIGEDILCVWTSHGFRYRHVRLLSNPNHGG